MYYVYILQSLKTYKYYIGSTKNLSIRLQQHNNNKTRSNKNKGPYKIIYFEKFITRSEAVKRELKVKSYKGGNAFRKLISGK